LRLREIANDITTLRRLTNIREEWKKENDMLPVRLLEEPINGNQITKDELNHMVNEYYQLRGWDEDGKPRNELSILRA
jgi:aldehyde:ferredoxin oxidoreductase